MYNQITDDSTMNELHERKKSIEFRKELSITLCIVSIVLLIVTFSLVSASVKIAPWITLVIALVLAFSARKIYKHGIAKMLIWIYLALAAAVIALIITIFLFTSVFTFIAEKRLADKEELIEYASNNFGECEFISDESEGKGRAKYYTINLKDMDTGINYSVTSCHEYHPFLEGGHYGMEVITEDDFSKAYTEYLIDKAEKEIAEIEREYSVEGIEYCEVYKFRDFVYMKFTNETDEETVINAAMDIDNALEKYDIKDLHEGYYEISCEKIVIDNIAYYRTFKFDPKTKELVS